MHSKFQIYSYNIHVKTQHKKVNIIQTNFKKLRNPIPTRTLNEKKNIKEM